MAMFETWLKSDFQEDLTVEHLRGNFFSGDSLGNLVGVEVFDNGEPASLSGSVVGYVIRADGSTVVVPGTLSGNRASIILPACAYNVYGIMSIVIKVGTVTVGACTVHVYRSTTDTLVDPEHVIPSIDRLIQMVEECEQAVQTKADKVSGATNNHFAGLDSNGNLKDSGKTASDFLASTLKGSNNGVAELDANGKVPTAQLPSYVDDVLEYASTSAFPATGEAGKIYVALDTNKTYRWTGSGYVEISASLALGETSSTAYRGDRGKAAYDHATDAGRMTTATQSGLYKVAVTDEGHVAGASPVQKSDITALGIPAQDTTYESKPAASGGTDESLVTTGEKYTWNQKYAKPSGGIPATDIASGVIPDVSGKADKVANPTIGNFAALDINGNLVDSGAKPSDFLTQHQDISGKADKVASATNGHLAGLDSNGNLTDSGATASELDEVLEYASESSFPVVGEAGKIYVAKDQNELFRWDATGNEYVSVGGGGGGTVTDVQEDGTSILNNGVANILTMTGASSSSAGTKGLVPAPAAGDQDKILMGSGSWSNEIPNRIANIENTEALYSVTIQTTDWSASPYTYTWSNSDVTADCSVEIGFLDGAEDCDIDFLEWEKATGSITFSVESLPSVALPIVIKLTNARAKYVEDLTADMVATDAVTGASNVDEALTALDAETTRLNAEVVLYDYNTAVSANSSVEYTLSNGISNFRFIALELKYSSAMVSIVYPTDALLQTSSSLSIRHYMAMNANISGIIEVYKGSNDTKLKVINGSSVNLLCRFVGLVGVNA